MADVEEPAVVDLVPRDPPVGQPVGLGGEDPVERVEGCGIPGHAVEAAQRLVDVLADLGRLLGEREQPPLHDLLLPHPLLDAPGVGLGTARQVLDGGEDAAQLLETGVLRPEPPGQGVQPVAQDQGVGAGRDGQPRPRVAEVEGPVRELQRELLRLQHPPVLVGQDGQQHAIAQLDLRRRPVDVEDLGPRGGGAVLQHVEPPGVGVARDAHVVRHDIKNETEALLAEPVRHAVEGGRAAQLRVERVVVGDVVAVRAAGPAAEAGREVDVADAERIEVGAERRDLVEAEGGAELQAVARPAVAAQRGHRLLEEHAGLDHPRASGS